MEEEDEISSFVASCPLLSDCPIFGFGSSVKFAMVISKWARLTGKFAFSERHALPSPNRIKTAKDKQTSCCPS
jgi:hypothetical protein